MNIIHDQYVYHKWHVFVMFFHALPRASYGSIWGWFIPSALRRLSNNFSSCFRCRKLALTRDTSYIFVFILGLVGRHVLGFSGILVCLDVCIGEASVHPLSVCTSPCVSVHPPYIKGHWGTICTSVIHCYICQHIHLSISSSIACQQLYNCGTVIPVDQHHYSLHAVSDMADFVTYVFWVLFLLLYFCPFGLEPYGCRLKLCAVDLF